MSGISVCKSLHPHIGLDLLAKTGEMAERMDVKGVFPDVNTAGAVCGPCHVWREADTIFSSPPPQKVAFGNVRVQLL